MKAPTRLVNAYTNKYYHWRVQRRLRKSFVDHSHAGDVPAIPMAASQPVILLGMHRSGTTLLSKLLRPSGLNLGAWRGGDTDESIYFQSLNDALLKVAHARWDEPQPFQRALTQNQVSQAMAGALADYLSAAALSKPFLGHRRHSILEQASPWGWKDPRTCYTLPLWLTLFPKAKILFIHRNGVDVAQSLVHRNQRLMQTQQGSLRCTTLSGAFELWEMYNQQCLKWLADVPPHRQHTVCFEHLMAQPEPILQEVFAFLEIENYKSNLDALSETIHTNRAHAFRTHPNLVEYYQAVADSPYMQEFGYHKLSV